MAIRSGGIEGLDQLIRDLQVFGDKAIPYLKTATNNASNILLAAARINLAKNKSIDTGMLYSSLKVKTAKTSKRNNMLVSGDVELGSDTNWVNADGKKGNYGAQVELGRVLKTKTGEFIKSVNGKPFMRPAADEHKGTVSDVIVDAINKAIRELGDL